MSRTGTILYCRSPFKGPVVYFVYVFFSRYERRTKKLQLSEMVGRRTKRKWSTEINVEVKIEMKLLQFDCLMSVAPQVVVFPLLWHLFAPNSCGYLRQKVTECTDSPIMHGYCPGRVVIPCPFPISPLFLWLMFPLGAEVPCRFRFEKGENAFNQQTICILNPCINMVYGPYYFQWKKA